MRARIGHPRTALIVAPHPDDEVVGAAGLIAALVRRGTRVAVLIVTDGAASHPGSRLWPRARLVAERRRESRRALRRLGLPAGAITCLNLPDGDLPAAEARGRRMVRRVVARLGAVGLLVGPVADDAHPDHRAVARMIAGLPRVRRRWSYRVWPPRRHPLARGIAVVAPGGLAAKRSLIAIHRTQTGGVRDDPAGFTMARHEIAAFSYPIEHFMEQRR